MDSCAFNLSKSVKFSMETLHRKEINWLERRNSLARHFGESGEIRWKNTEKQPHRISSGHLEYKNTLSDRKFKF